MEPGKSGDAEGVLHESPIGRRLFLGIVGVGALGTLFGKSAQQWLSKTVDSTGAPTGGLLPVERFRLYTVTDEFPVRAAEDWSMTVKGLCSNPSTFSYKQLQALPQSAMTKDFQCVTGWRVENVKWRGVKLSDLIDSASPLPEAKAITFGSFDGVYTESLTLEQARRDDVMLAYEMEGSAVSSDHGGPVRLVVAPMYGYKSLKWLDSIEFVDQVENGYWELRGYATDAWIGRSNGRTDEPV